MRLRSVPHGAAIFLFMASTALAAPETDAIEEIVVTADFRGRDAMDIAASVTLFDADEIEELAVQHFEELIYAVPNLNWSGDGHRARYLQIRGVGELEQYEGAPNPSVGFIVDDIDFSGIGTIATLFDIDRVEILRGPQGTRYGANALAGLVYVRSTPPGDEQSGRVQLTAASDAAFAGGVAWGGPIGDSGRVAWRGSAHHYRSDGFRDNSWLGRSDTNGRDETTLRGRLRWDASDLLEVNIAAMYSDIDNGYDAFAIDNSYTMLSDNPGRDAQESLGASLRFDYTGIGGATLTAISAFADSDIDFSFDADWGNEQSWAPYTYDYVSTSRRSRGTLSQEFRLASDADGRLFGGTTDWLVGLYALRLEDDLATRNVGEYVDPDAPEFNASVDEAFASRYTADNIALFGQLDRALGSATTLSVGLRIEHRDTDYRDSDGLRAGPSEWMAGGDITLSHEYSDDLSAYVSLSRGYKAGGFNLGAVPEGSREFGSEALWNLELGMRSILADGRVRLNMAVFGNRRDDQQVRTSLQLVPGDPATFVFLTDNAAEGVSLGLEADVRWLPTDAWELYASIGLLDATFENYLSPRFDESFNLAFVDLDGREQAHAPGYTLSVGGLWRHPDGWYARIDANARDEFYFDVSHDEKSEAYELVNLRVGYEATRWSVDLWSRNLFDERYAVRGFYFGNEPPAFAPELYTRAGDPRQTGLTFEWRF